MEVSKGKKKAKKLQQKRTKEAERMHGTHNNLAKRPMFTTSDVVAALRNTGQGPTKKQKIQAEQPGLQLRPIVDKDSSDKENTVPEEDYECCICLERIVEQGALNCCDHLFCFACIFKWSRRANLCPLCKRRFSQITKRRPGQPAERRRRAGENVRVRRKDLGSRHSDEEDEAEERRRRMLARQQMRPNHAPASFIIVDDTNDTSEVQFIPSFEISDDEGREEEEEEVIEIQPPSPERPRTAAPEPQWSTEIIDLTTWADSNRPEQSAPQTPTTTTTTTTTSTINTNTRHSLVLFDDDDILEVVASTSPQQPPAQQPPYFSGHVGRLYFNNDVQEEEEEVLLRPRYHRPRRRRENDMFGQPQALANSTTAEAPNATATTTTPSPPVILSIEDDDSWLNQTIF